MQLRNFHPSPHTVTLMVEFASGVLVLLSAGIFLAHAVAAYRTK
jgi:hypothetical protein